MKLKRPRERNARMPLRCPACGNDHLKVLETRSRSTRIWRVRQCLHCKKRFRTREEFHEMKPSEKSDTTSSVQN